jgi:hypothetical protein
MNADQTQTLPSESPGKEDSSGSRYLPSRWLALTILLLSVLMIVGVRVRLLDIPLERDEGEYAYLGQLILEGIPPYELASNMKMPGVYLAYAASMAVFGQTSAGIHLGLLVVNLSIMAALFFVARIFLDLYGAVIATVAYGLMVPGKDYFGLAAHASNFAMLFALLGTLVLLREKNGRWFASLGAGCLFGISFLMNQPGAAFGICGGLYLAWASIAEKVAWRLILVRVGIYLLGCVVPFLAVCLWLKIAGVFPQFWFWTFVYSREYATANSFSVGLLNAHLELRRMFYAASLVHIFAVLGFVCLWFARLPLSKRVFLASFLFFSILAVCPGLYFRPHYFIFLAPAIALLAGCAVSVGFYRLAQAFHQPLLYHFLFLLAALFCAQTFYVNRVLLFSLSPHDACRAIYGLEPFPESLDIARYIEQNSDKDQRVVVLGDEPQIYFYSHRHSSISQIYPSQTMDPRPFAHAMQERMISEVETNPPEYLVYCNIHSSLVWRQDSDPLLLNWMGTYAQQNMRLVGVIQFTGPQTTETVWGPGAETTPLISPYFVRVYRRSVPR